MSESILSPGKSISYSASITVEEGTSTLLAVYTEAGTDVGAGPVLVLQYQDINGEWLDVSTQPYGAIRLNQTVQHFVIATPGTYRVYRPDLQAWTFDVGVESYKFSNDGVPFTPTPSPVTCNDVPFDFATVNLTWIPANGEDFDPHMALTNPPRNNYIGWNRQSQDLDYIIWAGDHQGTSGEESFLLDMNSIKAAYPNFNDISFALTAFWYTRIGDGNIKVTLKTFSGGTMVNQDHVWVNVGGTQVSTQDYYANCQMALYGNEDKFGQPLGDVEYDYCAKQLTFNVLSPAVTSTPSPTATATPTPTVTATVTPTVTRSMTITPSNTPTISITPSVTRTPTRTPTITPTISVTPSITPTISVTPTNTRTPTVTATMTPSPSVTISITPTISVTPTNTRTPTITPTVTATVSVTPSITPTISVTPTISLTPTITQTPTRTPTPTSTMAVTQSVTPTISVTPTSTITPTVTQTATRTVTPTPETTKSQTPTITNTVTPTVTTTPTNTVTPTVTPTITASPTVTPTVTATVTPTVSVTATSTVTPTVTATSSVTPTVTNTVTPTVTPTISITPTISVTPSVTASLTPTPSVSVTASITPSASFVATPTPTPTPSNPPNIGFGSPSPLPNTGERYSSVGYSPTLDRAVANVYNVGTGTTQFAISDDRGLTWRNATTGTFSGATYANENKVEWVSALNLFASIGIFGYTSPTGEVWTRTYTGTLFGRSFAWSPSLGLAVVVGTGGRIFTTTNFVAFTSRTSPTSSDITDVCWSPELNLFVATTSASGIGSIIYSANGTSWGQANANTAQSMQSVVWSPVIGRFVAIGLGSSMSTSTNGTTWTSIPAATNKMMVQGTQIFWSAMWNTFVVISTNNPGSRATTSSDGMTWNISGNSPSITIGAAGGTYGTLVPAINRVIMPDNTGNVYNIQ